MENLKDKLNRLYEQRDYNDKIGLDDYDLDYEIKQTRQELILAERKENAGTN